MQASELFQDGPHRLVQRIREDFERLPIGVGLGLIIHRQRLFDGLQGQPDIAALIPLTDAKDFIQELDGAIGSDAPDGMDAAFTQRQVIWDARRQCGGQTLQAMALAQAVGRVRLARAT